MSGDSLADWQTIVKALNERIQAMGNFGWSLFELTPVPTSKDHITTAFVSQVGNIIGSMFGVNWTNSFWCDPDNPLIIQHPGDPGWNGNYQTGNYIYGPSRWVPFQVYPYQYNGDFDTRSIYASIPSFNSIPLRGAELAKIGDFLDWCSSAFLLLTKTALHTNSVFNNISGKHSAFRWNQSTGEIQDSGTYSVIGSASTFSDFYFYALTNMTDYTSTGTPSCQSQVYNDGTYIWLTLDYCSGPIFYGNGMGATPLTTPGGIEADLTVYYSSFGDNCGYPVNSSSTHIDYSTVTFQNIGPETPINFGFDASSVSTVPAMPSAGDTYTKQESLQEINAVWDFSNHFQYCV